MIVLTAEQAAEVDRRTIEGLGVPGPMLMETAGRAVARALMDGFGPEVTRGTVVCCGPGNNGGDGLVVARALALRSRRVTVILLEDPDRFRGDAALAWRLLRDSGNSDRVTVMRADDLEFETDPDSVLRACRSAGVVVDCLFGTGLARPLEGRALAVVQRMNAAGTPIVAVDIPSGVNGTTGHVLGPAVNAHTTVTIGFLKRGLLLYPGAAHCGTIKVAEIGFPPAVAEEVGDGVELFDPHDVCLHLPLRPATAHKGTSGRVAILAGAIGMTGAAILSTRAALRAGGGLVTLALPASLNASVEPSVLEALSHPIPDGGRGWLGSDALGSAREALEGAAAAAVGPGVGRREETTAVLRQLISEVRGPMVVDADGLLALQPLDLPEPRGAGVAPDVPPAPLPVEPDAPRLRPARQIVVTPHPGEMSRLMDRSVPDILADPIGTARACALRYGVVALLKGAHTVIAAPDGRVRINWTGNPGMASGGMGDVLTGLIAALLGQGLDAFDAASVGAFVHGRAADRVAERRGQQGLLAGDVVDEIPPAIRELQETPEVVPFPTLV